MTRKKVTLAYITNDSERKASFKKRKKGLIKKVSELSTLCGVEACAIIYSHYDAEPEVWPSRMAAQAVLARFRKLSEMDQCRKMVNQESFTRQRIKKAEEQHRRISKENKRRDMENFMFQFLAGMVTLDHFDLRDAAEMSWLINQMLRDINSKMEMLKRKGKEQQSVGGASTSAGGGGPAYQMLLPPPPAPAPAPPVAPLPAADPPLALPAPDDVAADDMDGFPWNLMDSPTAGFGGGSVYGGTAWNEGFMMPPPPNSYVFNPDDFSTVAPDDEFGFGFGFGSGFGFGFGSGFGPGEGSGSGAGNGTDGLN